MPYIKPDDRKTLDSIVDAIKSWPALSSGELNYLLTVTIETYLYNHGMSYRTINDIMGAMEGSKLEFYRRIVIPYENLKIAENGDVYKKGYKK